MGLEGMVEQLILLLTFQLPGAKIIEGLQFGQSFQTFSKYESEFLAEIKSETITF